MSFRLLTTIILLTFMVTGCGLVDTTTPIPTRTPRPTITATFAATLVETELAPTEEDTATPEPVLTVTGTEQAVTGTKQAVTLAAQPTETPAPSETLTTRPGIVRATRVPLQITNMLLVNVTRDPARENGAIAFVQVVYTGGRGPYTIYHDDVRQTENPFQVLTVCHGTLIHTIRLVSGDRQVVTKNYYLSPVDCPPS